MHWNRHNSWGHFKIMLPSRSKSSWHFSVREFAARHVPESDFPVYRAPSTYPNAGSGMFASRFLYNGEVVAEYTGTMKRMSHDEFNELMKCHEDDGNGLVEVGSLWCLDPYVVDGVTRRSEDAIGVWANHRCVGHLGCNLKLVATP